MRLASIIRKLPSLCGVLAMCAVCGNAAAQPLDDVSLEYQSEGIVATIRMTSPVQYLRHFPEKSGNTLEVFYDRVQGANNEEVWVDNETRSSPPSGLIPSFTVTTRDQKTQPKLVIEFAREAEFSVAPGKDNRSIRITIRPNRQTVAPVALPALPVIKPEPAAPAVALTGEEAALAENNKLARALMVQGRDALSAKNHEAAVEAFNKLLLLPPNDYSQDGQEWVGVARERAGQIDKAKTEYDLYLRLYQDGESANRVMQRLAGLFGQGGAQVVTATEEKKKAARWMTFGGISSRYYFGNSTNESTQVFNSVPETITTKMTDQSMLITNEDVSGRYMSDEYDGRVVFRASNTQNFLSNKPSLNRVSSAYGEIKSRTQDYMLRVGRQSAMGGGVMGRFDGVYGTYGDAQDMKVNGVVGVMADYSQGAQPMFFGAGYDIGPYSFYALNQSVDGVLDRRALGAEWRYYEGNQSAYAQVDFDTVFKDMTLAQLTGSTAVYGVNLNFLLNHSKPLSTRNALYGAATSSISTLLNSMSASTLRDLASARTTTADMGQVGVSIPFKQKWQVGGDVRLSNTSGLSASGVANTLQGYLAAVPSRGLEKSVTANIVGSSLYMENDIWSVSTTVSTSGNVNGNSIYLANHTQYRSGWAMDTSLQIYRQTDQLGGVTTRWSPMVRGAYRIRDTLTFDADFGYDSTKNDGAQVTNKMSRIFGSAGLRWDF
ncbi:MAG: tetratricopeptide repeat protein [Gallionella sp.]|nr:tetratricopeptide repeat protein [Gallionella sp.]